MERSFNQILRSAMTGEGSPEYKKVRSESQDGVKGAFFNVEKRNCQRSKSQELSGWFFLIINPGWATQFIMDFADVPCPGINFRNDIFLPVVF